MESEDGLVNELEASIHAEDMGVLRAAVSRAQAHADAPRLTKHLQLALIVLAVRSATAAEDELLVCKRSTEQLCWSTKGTEHSPAPSVSVSLSLTLAWAHRPTMLSPRPKRVG